MSAYATCWAILTEARVTWFVVGVFVAGFALGVYFRALWDRPRPGTSR